MRDASPEATPATRVMQPPTDPPDSMGGFAMIDFSRNHFELFGLPARFDVDPAVLDRAYHALQGVVHPDRHATAGAAAQRLALQSSARVNEAYGALKDPVARAQYLLSLRGVDALSETETSLPIAFLERQLERREAAAEAAAARDLRALVALLGAVNAESAELEQRIAGLLDTEESLDAARARVREFKFLRKFAADIDAMQGELEG